jgi:hypothetical protein
MKHWQLLITLSWLLVSPTHAQDIPDEQKIIRLMKSTWQKPESRLDVAPISIVHEYAIVGWIQGQHGGRALLRKQKEQWRVIMCGGDGLLDKNILKNAGIPTSTASALLEKTLAAENHLSKNRLRSFASFRNTQPIN